MQSSLTSIGIIAQLNKTFIDPQKIIRKHGLKVESEPEMDLIKRIFKEHEFKVKTKKLNEKNLKDYPLPCLVQLKDNSYLTILRYDEKNLSVLVINEKNKNPFSLSFQELLEISNSDLLILTHKTITTNAKFGFKWFFTQILQYKKIVFEILLVSFIIQLFGLVTPIFTQVILDKVLVHQTLSTLNVIAFAFIVIIIFELILGLARNYIFIHTTSKIDSKLGSKIFWHLVSLPLVYFENRKVGNIIARVRELDQIREFVANKSVTLLLDVLFSFVFIGMMFLYSPKLTIITLTFVFLIALLYFFVTPELRRRLEHKFQMGANSNSYLVESVTGIQTVKSLSIEGNIHRKWENHLGNYVESNFKLTNISNFLSSLSGFLQKLMTLAILYFGVGLVIEQQLTVGQLIAFQMFAGQFSAPIMRLVGLWNEFQQTLLSVDRLGDILNSPIENENKKALTIRNLKGKIVFKNVGFRYSPTQNNVLSGFTLEIESGERVGIVGRSGSGKSTLTKLIQRLYIANEGSIYLDGIDVKHINSNWLRQNIGIVLQDNYLFSGTIKENIEYPSMGAAPEKIIEVSKIAGADQFISEFPEGYDTLVGERGSTLSGGQKQRIAIARALISNPKILIFDEATSALDYESERAIQNNMDLIAQNRTMIIIAHRLSTVKDCDKIIVVDEGKFVESGTHEELLEKEGYYYNLYKSQS